MKSFALTLSATAVSSAAIPQALLNLRNHNLLSSNKEVSRLESIAHIATFEDVPIFGGVELREQMLEQSAIKEHSHFDALANGFFNTVIKATKMVGCQT